MKMLQKGSFVMVFGGSVVTAGYANYFNQSYPIVLQKRLEPIFQAIGVKLIVRNVAHKHMGCRVMNYCMEALGGTDYDLIGREPSIFHAVQLQFDSRIMLPTAGWEHSFSCGSQRDVFEFFARLAGWNQAIAYYSASGSFSTSHCKRSPVSSYIVYHNHS